MSMTDISIPSVALMAAVTLLSATPQEVNIGQLPGEQSDTAPATFPPISQIPQQSVPGQVAQSDAVVDQLNNEAPITGSVDQLSDTLEPVADSDEDALASHDRPKADLTSQVIAAWNVIRQRGQTPTPDLIANEIGADKVAEFLALGGPAASVLATGQLPDIPTGDPKGRMPPPPPPIGG